MFETVLAKATSACPATAEPRPPNSWSDALAMVEKAMAERNVKKDKRLSRALADQTAQPAPPGTIVGNIPDQSVFWLFMEVRTQPMQPCTAPDACFAPMQDYFRDLCVDDFQLLMPGMMETAQDPALTVPFLGREKVTALASISPSLGRACMVPRSHI